MGPIWGWQRPVWPHVGPTNFAIWDIIVSHREDIYLCHFRMDESYKMQKRTYTFLLIIQHINCDSVIIDLIDTRWQSLIQSSLVQVIAWHLFNAKPLHESILMYYWFDRQGEEKLQWNFNQNTKFLIEKMLFAKCQLFCLGLNVLKSAVSITDWSIKSVIYDLLW